MLTLTRLDYGASPKVPYILDEFTYFFETPYDTTDPKFAQCDIDRPPKSNGKGLMYIVNHFLEVDLHGILTPDYRHAGRTNAVTGSGSIGEQAKLCTTKHGRPPNVVLVDYVGKGDVIKAQNLLNGLS